MRVIMSTMISIRIDSKSQQQQKIKINFFEKSYWNHLLHMRRYRHCLAMSVHAITSDDHANIFVLNDFRKSEKISIRINRANICHDNEKQANHFSIPSIQSYSIVLKWHCTWVSRIQCTHKIDNISYIMQFCLHSMGLVWFWIGSVQVNQFIWHDSIHLNWTARSRNRLKIITFASQIKQVFEQYSIESLFKNWI